jgi:hypothetical protein
MDASNAPGSQLEFGELSGSGSPKRGDRPKQREPRRAPAARQVLPEGAPYAIYERDAVEWLCGLPDESVDLVVTDPPYESLEKHRAIGTTTRLKHSKASSNDWFRIFPNARFPELFREVYRVLSRDRHFYLFSDAETMFVVKPIAEAAGFKFWKPLVWDKCLGPETPVRTDRGVLRADAVAAGDSVFTPDGRTTTVLAVRQTTAPAVRLALSTGATLLASCEHRFLLADGTQAEASSLRSGAALASGATASSSITAALSMDALLDDEERVLEMPDPHACLFCGKQFDSVRGAAAHQARFCEAARSKASMAEAVGVAPKRLRRWMSEGRIPAAACRNCRRVARSYVCRTISRGGIRLPSRSTTVGANSSACSRQKAGGPTKTSPSHSIGRRSISKTTFCGRLVRSVSGGPRPSAPRTE